MRSDNTFIFYSSVAGGAQTQNSLVIPPGEFISIKAIDFAGPPGGAIMQLVLDPRGTAQIIGAASGDKYILLPSPGITIQGPAQIDAIVKSEATKAVVLGVSIYYERL